MIKNESKLPSIYHWTLSSQTDDFDVLLIRGVIQPGNETSSHIIFFNARDEYAEWTVDLTML